MPYFHSVEDPLEERIFSNDWGWWMVELKGVQKGALKLGSQEFGQPSLFRTKLQKLQMLWLRKIQKLQKFAWKEEVRVI